MSSNCVADFSAARTNLRPLYNLWFCFVADVTVSPSPRTPQRTRNSEPATCRAIVCEQTRCPSNSPHASASHIQYLASFAVFVSQAAHTLALSHVPDLSQIFLSGLTSSMKSCFPLFRSNARRISLHRSWEGGWWVGLRALGVGRVRQGRGRAGARGGVDT